MATKKTPAKKVAPKKAATPAAKKKSRSNKSDGPGKGGFDDVRQGPSTK
jgi:hypothetical protein